VAPQSPAQHPAQRTLADLPPGASARIERVEATPIGRRLLDLGFVPETPIRVLRRAPLGDPTTYELRGTRLCLRRAEALAVWVSQGAEGDAA
jgi:Fe2+ transport system protein FeoA